MLGPRRKPIASAAVAGKSRSGRSCSKSRGKSRGKSDATDKRKRSRSRRRRSPDTSQEARRKRSRSRRRRSPDTSQEARRKRSRSRRRRSSSASEEKRRKRSRSRRRRSSDASEEKKRTSDDNGHAKKKRYAWMDSGDESGEGAASDSSGASSKREPTERGDKKRNKEEADDRPLPERLADVGILSDMVRLAQTLQRHAARMAPKEIVAVVTAAARVKFYDHDVFQSGLLPAARRHLQRHNGAFAPDDAVSLVSGLADLNVYDKVIFSKIVEGFAQRKQDLEDTTRRGRLLTSYKKAGHEGDKDFIEYLTTRQKEENYQKKMIEAAREAGPLIYYGGLRK